LKVVENKKIDNKSVLVCSGAEFLLVQDIKNSKTKNKFKIVPKLDSAKI